MYKLYLDKPEEFTCEISVKNASLKNSMARLIMESEQGINLVFNGKIENGKCIIPIRRLKGIIDENIKGKIKLEVIVEDTYFLPWHDDFCTEEHTSVKVHINEQKSSIYNKISVNTKVINKSAPSVIEDVSIPLCELKYIFNKLNIHKNNIINKKQWVIKLLNEYFQINPEFRQFKLSIIKQLYDIS